MVTNLNIITTMITVFFLQLVLRNMDLWTYSLLSNRCSKLIKDFYNFQLASISIYEQNKTGRMRLMAIYTMGYLI